jgi:tetratricopeptide (TPR) repeat protein
MTASEHVLTAALEQRIRRLCSEGYLSYDGGDYDKALRRFYQAWTLLPKPQTGFTASGWVLTAIGDAYFAKRNFAAGIEALRSALYCPQAVGNPFIHLRLGQCYLEQGEQDDADRHLVRALQTGAELFAREETRYRSRAEQALARWLAENQGGTVIALGSELQPG